MKTIIRGVGDTIQVPVTPPWPGQTLAEFDVPDDTVQTLEALSLQFHIGQGDPAHYIFHIFVKGADPNVEGSPWWTYAMPNNPYDPLWWGPKNYQPHLRIAGPAHVVVMAINITGYPQSLYWSSLWIEESLS